VDPLSCTRQKRHSSRKLLEIFALISEDGGKLSIEVARDHLPKQKRAAASNLGRKESEPVWDQTTPGKGWNGVILILRVLDMTWLI
jgi:hypothetical protein